MNKAWAQFAPRSVRFLQNPVWYVTTVVILTGLVFYLRFLWWLVGAVALVWGLFLVWQMFGGDTAEAGAEAQPGLPNLSQAQGYKTQIQHALRTASSQGHAVQQQRLAAQIDIWVEAVQELEQRLAELRQNDLIYRDLTLVPRAIEKLEAQLVAETDTATRRQLARALTNRRQQLASLELLQNTIRRAEIQIEDTLSRLGTIYSQLLTGQSTRYVADYGRLSTDIDEEVDRLQDRLAALREVKLDYRQFTSGLPASCSQI